MFDFMRYYENYKLSDDYLRQILFQSNIYTLEIYFSDEIREEYGIIKFIEFKEKSDRAYYNSNGLLTAFKGILYVNTDFLEIEVNTGLIYIYVCDYGKNANSLIKVLPKKDMKFQDLTGLNLFIENNTESFEVKNVDYANNMCLSDSCIIYDNLFFSNLGEIVDNNTVIVNHGNYVLRTESYEEFKKDLFNLNYIDEYVKNINCIILDLSSKLSELYGDKIISEFKHLYFQYKNIYDFRIYLMRDGLKRYLKYFEDCKGLKVYKGKYLLSCEWVWTRGLDYKYYKTIS